MIDKDHIKLYHFAEYSDWKQRDSLFYSPPGLRQEGFIHFSEDSQLWSVYKRYYWPRRDLMMLVCRFNKDDECLVYEDSYNRGEEFPHVYCKIPMKSILKAVDLNDYDLTTEKEMKILMLTQGI
ncbi:MAG: DUF952 domain-containing protein [Balneolales bacterium]|nr:DUF952 domain-containing protein [Balneolales bacterium]